MAALAGMPAVASPAGSEQCVQCHPEAVREYLLSGMGRSISKPSPNHPAGVYGHGVSGTTFRVTSAAEGLVQEIERDGLSAKYAVDYVIGSGNAAFGYLVRVGDALFQSPVTYYTEHRRWGMAPGMEAETDPDFSRPVTSECLWCHAGRPEPLPNTVNRYKEPFLDPEAISCDRCHGPADRHIREPTAGSIFNPATAPPRERDSVCEQCHLGGAIRILHPGRTFGSFQPGRRLEEFWSVFVGRSQGQSGQDRFQVVSHVEQLALSRCAEQTGEAFWCGTCHNPHEIPSDPRADFSRRCLNCHEQGLPSGHAARKSDCISCHMPRRHSHDSGHSAFTDHRITRLPMPQADPMPPAELRPWKPVPGDLRLRNLGIANVLYGQQRGSPEVIQQGIEQLKSVSRAFRRDSAVRDALGTAMVLDGSHRAGLRLLQQSVAEGPAGALQYNALAAAWWAVGNSGNAVSTLGEAIRREPMLESSYHLLAQVHRELGQAAKEKQTWQRLLEVRPRLINVRQEARKPEALPAP